jgi:hypothetical protein
MIKNKYKLTTIYLASEEDRRLWYKIRIEATRRGVSMTQFILRTMKAKLEENNHEHESATRIPDENAGSG